MFQLLFFASLNRNAASVVVVFCGFFFSLFSYFNENGSLLVYCLYSFKSLVFVCACFNGSKSFLACACFNGYGSFFVSACLNGSGSFLDFCMVNGNGPFLFVHVSTEVGNFLFVHLICVRLIV